MTRQARVALFSGRRRYQRQSRIRRVIKAILGKRRRIVLSTQMSAKPIEYRRFRL